MSKFVSISITVPEEILLSLRVERDEFAAQMKALTALKLFESRKLSIGQAAAFAGMCEADFVRFLGQHKVSIFGTATDIAEDYAHA